MPRRRRTEAGLNLMEMLYTMVIGTVIGLLGMVALFINPVDDNGECARHLLEVASGDNEAARTCPVSDLPYAPKAGAVGCPDAENHLHTRPVAREVDGVV